MKVFDSKAKNSAYLFYRLINPIIDPFRLIRGMYGYLWFLNDIVKYKIKDPKAKLLNINLFPMLHEKTPYTSFDPQFFHQQLWAFERILKNKPKVHVDVGSSHQFNGYVSKITKAVFIDLRPIKAHLKNLQSKKGDILNLPYKNSSIESVSSLCVAGHIGLGRYGDAIDPNGMEKACKELARVLAKNGRLYFSTTTGKERICFNAHRVMPPTKIIRYFKGLKLLSFSVVSDDSKFYDNVGYKDFEKINYGTGMFVFTKI